MNRRNLLWLAVLVLANLLLLGAIFQIWFGKESPEGIAGAKKPLPLSPPRPAKASEPVDNFAVVATKNLFSPNRLGANLSTDKRPGLEGDQLLGTIIIGEEKTVIIGSSGKGGLQNVRLLHPGDQLGGWRVVEITKDEVVLQGDEGVKTLTFPRPKGKQ